MTELIAGVLGEAFEISNRGVVIIVKLVGDVVLNNGDVIKIEHIMTPIKGIEMINFGSHFPPKHRTGLGLLVEGKKAEYEKLRTSTVFLVQSDA